LSSTYVETMLAQLKERCEAWQEKWFKGPLPAPIHPTSQILLQYYAHRTRCSLIDFESRLRNIPIEQDIDGFSALTDAGIDSLRFMVDVLAPSGILTFAPDLVTLYSAKIGLFLTKVCLINYQYSGIELL